MPVSGSGLARVTIAAPARRVDLTLPEHVAVAELLPSILRHAGEDLADRGEKHGGWVLRRGTGEVLTTGQTLAAQRVQDGEVLHLSPQRLEWPEPDYDDLVEAIARGSRRSARHWSPAATRRTGLTIAVAVLLIGVVDLVGPHDQPALVGGAALLLAAALVLTGVALSRALADANAGGIIAAGALPYAFVGGVVVVATPGDGALAAPHLLVGSLALALFGLIGYVGVAALEWVFVAATTVGLLGALAALLGRTALSTVGIAAVTVTVAVGSLPALPLLAARLGRLPFPVLPQRPEEALAEPPRIPLTDVFAAAARTGEVLTGLLWGVGGSAVVAVVILIHSGQIPALILAGVVTAALLLRSRLHPTARQRVALLASGVVAAVAATGTTIAAQPEQLLPVRLVAVVLVAGAVAAAGLVYSTRSPTPFAGRLADIADAVIIAALIPFACAVVGLYERVRAALSTIGG
jgi:type VII secretion integral membrane protein EccD